MKNIRNILLGAALIICANAYSQDTVSFSRLPFASVSNMNDLVPVIQGDSTVAMTITIFNDYIADSLAAHTDTLKVFRDSIDNIHARVVTSATNIANNDVDIATLQTAVGESGDSIVVFRDSIDNLHARILTNKSSIVSNDADIAANTALINTNISDIDDNADTLEVFRDSIDNLDTRVLAVKATADAAGDSATSQNTRLSAIEADYLTSTHYAGDDHTQYLNSTRAAAWLATMDHSVLLNSGDSTHASLDAHLADTTGNPHHLDLFDVGPDTTGNNGKYIQFLSGAWTLSTAGGGGGAGGDTTHFHTDTISEYTGGYGVLIDGLLIKDGGIGYVDDSIQAFSDTLQYLLPYASIVDGIKDSSRVSMSIGTINEYSAGSGVTIDGLTIKDGGLTSNYRLAFGDGDTYISESGDDYLTFTLGTHVSGIWQYGDFVLYSNFRPISASTYDLGTLSARWRNIYADSIIVRSGNGYIRYKASTGELAFKDNVTSEKTLAELAAGGDVQDSSWTSLTVDTINTTSGAYILNNSGWLMHDPNGIVFSSTNNNIDFKTGPVGSLNLRISNGTVLSYCNIIPSSGKYMGTISNPWTYVVGSAFTVDSSDHTITTSGDNLLFKDGNNPSGVTLSTLAAGGGGASDSTFYHASIDTISELTPAHGVLIDGVKMKDNDVILPSLGQVYLDGGNDTYLNESSANVISAVVGSSTELQISGSSSTFGGHVIPSTAGLNLGGGTYWNNIYATKLYLTSSSNGLTVSGDSLFLDDGHNTPLSLSQIYTAYSASVLDAQPLDTAVILKADTVKIFGFTVGFGEIVDTAVSTTTGSYIDTKSIPDSSVITELVVWADSAGIGTVPSFSIQGNFKAGGDLSSAGVDFFSSAQAVGGSEPVTTGERFTTFANQVMPAGDLLIEFKLSSLTNKFSRLIIMGKGYYVNDD